MIALAVLLVLIVAVWLVANRSGVKRLPTGELAVPTLVERVGKHIYINSDEVPTVATVQDPESLKQTNPAFYVNVKVGDRLLVWSDKAVLYSETEDKILSVLPIDLLMQQTAPPTTSTTTSEEPPVAAEETPIDEVATIEIRNGTLTPGLAKNLADKLNAAGLETLKPRDAGAKDYENTIIINLSDEPLTATLAKIQGLVNAEVQDLPSTETNANSDLIIIIGNDYQP
ncbi:LytR C-terminal domain-containing protein [Patescibacteria group bacterium]|nr:LytR C-terminal domain-containing protein [Patescibacteria group bacterium]MBU1629984.1 LytR C-terminal domain-containing protein [Patescibacteria group bacterium]